MIDLIPLSFAELAELRDAVTREIEVRRTNAILEARSEVQRLAKSVGLTVEELVAVKPNQPKTKKQKAQTETKTKTIYRHPTAAHLLWTGRGRKPRWIQELEAQGVTLESMQTSEGGQAA